MCFPFYWSASWCSSRKQDCTWIVPAKWTQCRGQNNEITPRNRFFRTCTWTESKSCLSRLVCAKRGSIVVFYHDTMIQFKGSKDKRIKGSTAATGSRENFPFQQCFWSKISPKKKCWFRWNMQKYRFWKKNLFKGSTCIMVFPNSSLKTTMRVSTASSRLSVLSEKPRCPSRRCSERCVSKRMSTVPSSSGDNELGPAPFESKSRQIKGGGSWGSRYGISQMMSFGVKSAPQARKNKYFFAFPPWKHAKRTFFAACGGPKNLRITSYQPISIIWRKKKPPPEYKPGLRTANWA